MTKLTVEITLDISGRWVPYRPATPPSYSSGGDPPEGGYAEDLTITGIEAETSQRTPEGKWKVADILAGVDLSSPGVSLLLQNLIDAFEPEIQEAIAGDI